MKPNEIYVPAGTVVDMSTFTATLREAVEASNAIRAKKQQLNDSILKLSQKTVDMLTPKQQHDLRMFYSGKFEDYENEFITAFMKIGRANTENSETLQEKYAQFAFVENLTMFDNMEKAKEEKAKLEKAEKERLKLEQKQALFLRGVEAGKREQRDESEAEKAETKRQEAELEQAKREFFQTDQERLSILALQRERAFAEQFVMGHMHSSEVNFNHWNDVRNKMQIAHAQFNELARNNPGVSKIPSDYLQYLYDARENAGKDLQSIKSIAEDFNRNRHRVDALMEGDPSLMNSMSQSFTNQALLLDRLTGELSQEMEYVTNPSTYTPAYLTQRRDEHREIEKKVKDNQDNIRKQIIRMHDIEKPSGHVREIEALVAEADMLSDSLNSMTTDPAIVSGPKPATTNRQPPTTTAPTTADKKPTTPKMKREKTKTKKEETDSTDQIISTYEQILETHPEPGSKSEKTGQKAFSALQESLTNKMSKLNDEIHELTGISNSKKKATGEKLVKEFDERMTEAEKDKTPSSLRKLNEIVKNTRALLNKK